MPLYMFWLPMYSFWNFDDFSWGNTRAVNDLGEIVDNSRGNFDKAWIPMKTWKEFVIEDYAWRKSLSITHKDAVVEDEIGDDEIRTGGISFIRDK